MSNSKDKINSVVISGGVILTLGANLTKMNCDNLKKGLSCINYDNCRTLGNFPIDSDEKPEENKNTDNTFLFYTKPMNGTASEYTNNITTAKEIF